MIFGFRNIIFIITQKFNLVMENLKSCFNFSKNIWKSFVNLIILTKKPFSSNTFNGYKNIDLFFTQISQREHFNWSLKVGKSHVFCSSLVLPSFNHRPLFVYLLKRKRIKQDLTHNEIESRRDCRSQL